PRSTQAVPAVPAQPRPATVATPGMPAPPPTAAVAARARQHYDRAMQAHRVAGYAAQAEVIRASGQDVAGWKIAATSAAGQKHIGVDGPLAGPLLANRILENGAAVPIDGNIM